jgi:hypothetical protein
MAVEKKAFPLRAHHLDFAFSMAATLDRHGKKEIQISEALRPLLSDASKLDYEELTEDDIFFLGVLANLAWHVRQGFSEKTQSTRDYDKDLLGNDETLFETYIDQLTLATSRSIFAVFLPDTLIEIGDVLDGNCLACAVGDHCLSHKSNDLAVLLQLRNFIAGKSELTPSADILERERDSQVDVINAERIKAFLMDRVESVIIDKLELKDNVILVPMFFRVLLMAKKRDRGYF